MKANSTPWMTLTEWARHLRVHPQTARKILDEFPHLAVRVGAQIRIHADDADRFLRDQRVEGRLACRPGRPKTATA